MNRTLPLVALSFLALFLEVAMIRWIPGAVRLMGYYSNLVLISSFLGLGGGMLLARSTRRLEAWFAPLLAATIAIGHFSPWLIQQRAFAVACALALVVLFGFLLRHATPSWRRFLVVVPVVLLIGGLYLQGATQDSGGLLRWLAQGYAAWGGKGGLSISWLFVVPSLFLLNTAIFICLGQPIGRELDRFEPLLGYSLNIAGSLLGVIAFGLCSYFATPPRLWFAVVCIGMLPFVLRTDWPRAMGTLTLLAVCVFLVGHAQTGRTELWSPYYKIEVDPYPEGRQPYSLLVNHSFHQAAYDLSGTGDSVLRRRWDLPYELARPKRVLILGAGNGNDAAAAIRAGAEHIDAVEIDPVILRFGREHHPENPYGSATVTTHVDDARAFLRNTDQRYDLIAFGTLDSHTLFSGMGNVRLDSYVYTVESIREARDHLTEDGVLTVTFSVGRDWIATKLHGIVEQAFGHPPLVYYPEGEDSGTVHKVFVASLDQEALIARGRRLGAPALTLETIEGVTLPTDDWPHLYIKQKSLSNEYVAVIVILSLFSVLLTRAAVGKAAAFDPTFFLLGAGFLLLETKSVTYLALLFGSTWVVNCFVFSAILVTALLANGVVHVLKPKRTTAAFAALLAVLVVLLLLEPSRLLVASPALRMLIAMAFVGLPVLFSGLVFSTLFARVKDPASALGSNLIGAVIGGFLEYASLLLGSRMIYALALLIYALAWMLSARNNSTEAVATAAHVEG